MGLYHTTISTDGSGNGSNLANGIYNWTGHFRGKLRGVFVDDNGAAATLDVTITEPNGLKRTILTATDVTSDTTYNPEWQVQTNAGVAVTGAYRPFRVESSNLLVSIAQGGNNIASAVIVTVDIEEDRWGE
jgi:hypothetical protein